MDNNLKIYIQAVYNIIMVIFILGCLIIISYKEREFLLIDKNKFIMVILKIINSMDMEN